LKKSLPRATRSFNLKKIRRSSRMKYMMRLNTRRTPGTMKVREKLKATATANKMSSESD
jgi:hypothetical protein